MDVLAIIGAGTLVIKAASNSAAVETGAQLERFPAGRVFHGGSAIAEKCDTTPPPARPAESARSSGAGAVPVKAPQRRRRSWES
jgi:hypothetical protein